MKYLYLYSFVFSFPFLQLNSQAVDTTFGDPYSFAYPQNVYIPGITGSDFDERADRSYSMLFLDDGKIIVAGHTYGDDGNDFAFTRLLPDGKYDESAGPDGEVRLDLGFPNDSCLSASLYQSDKMLMGGCASPAGQTGCSALIVRTDFDGNLDAGFGSQGQVFIDLPGTWEMVTEIIPLPDDKIFIAGNIYYGPSFKYPDSTKIFIGRLEPDGQIDSTFGVDGFVYTQLGNCVASILGDVLVYDDGSVLITGAGYAPYPGDYLFDFICNPNIHLYRFTENGAPDPYFGDNGVARLPGTEGRGNALYVYEDGRIVVAGMTSDFLIAPVYTIVARLLPNGTRDSTFSGDGYFREFFHGVLGYGAEPVDVFLVNDELLVGILDGSLGSHVTFGALCLTDEGQLNPNFGQDGIFNHISLFPQALYSLNDVKLSDDEQSMYFGGTYRVLGNDNMFISKLDISDKNPTLTRELGIINKLNIYPSPANDGYVYIDLPGAIDLEGARINICDYTGATLAEWNLDLGLQIDEKIDVSGLSNGLYIVTLFSGNEHYVGKFAVFK